MKFSYIGEDEAARKCIAYVSDSGFLYIRDEDGDSAICLSNYGVGKDPLWDENEAIKKFYEGDSVTITF